MSVDDLPSDPVPFEPEERLDAQLADLRHRRDRIVDELRRHWPHASRQLVDEAFELAFAIHVHTPRRKTGEEYIVHPIGVALACAQHKLDDVSIAAALLHDAVEDAVKIGGERAGALGRWLEMDGLVLDEQSLEMLLRSRFGDELADLVRSLTKLRRDQVEEEVDPRFATHKRLLEATETSDIRALVIKIFDRCDNIRTIDVFRPYKQHRIATETMRFYVPIAARLGFFKEARQMEDEVLRVLQPKLYQRIQRWFERTFAAVERRVDEQMAELQREAPHPGLVLRYTFYPKGIFTIASSLGMEEARSSEIAEGCNFNLCIVAPTEDACFRVLSLVHHRFTHVRGTVTDFIHRPKINGYRSLHTIVTGSRLPKLQVLIRTAEMDEENHLGVITELREGKLHDPRWIRDMLDTLQGPDDEALLDLASHAYFPEIDVFTPAGDRITLPQGATALDLAYHIHTEIGERARRAVIDGKQRPIGRRLLTGQRVRIEVADEPLLGYARLRLVTTDSALKDLRLALRRMERAAARRALDGLLAYLRDELDIPLRRGSFEFQALLDRLQYHKPDVLGRELATGRIDYERVLLHLIRAASPPVLRRLMRVFVEDGSLTEDEVEQAMQIRGRRRQRGLLFDILCEHFRQRDCAAHSIELVDPRPRRPMPMRLGGCCRPERPEPIVAHCTRERGAVIHSVECRSVTHMMALTPWPPPLAAARWVGEPPMRFVEYAIRGQDRRGLTARVTRRLLDWKLNMDSISFRGEEDGTASGHVALELDEFTDPEELRVTLSRIEGVTEVEIVEGA